MYGANARSTGDNIVLDILSRTKTIKYTKYVDHIRTSPANLIEMFEIGQSMG